ncbi:ATP-binding cassette subfamily B protein [Arcticibacter tournemirensis]|uniref:ABC transporter ATP-binding protein n=1 Tax=Arcticibacter tournemirensis TaxID=699437 RepID=A0A5M9HI67_9SPHI|nr:ABC transporter ATP-binding protein [Arcticibacter tournemirensis]KAA8486716.1 ABC transporter ATP-binding protein [Arcticibacter tournemirensis]TQM49255.1 ATP-binding cassette subfamily B protein [Arcticibacter tournemirensis]
MAKVAGKAYDINLLKRIFTYIKPYKRIFAWSITLTIALAIVSPLRPLLIQFTLDKYILTDDKPGLTSMTLLMLFLLVLQAVIQYYHTFLTNKLGQSTIRDLRINVFNHISTLKLRFFDKTPIGQLITRTVSDLETIADIFSEGLIVIAGDILQLITLLAVMLYIDWQLTLIVLLPMPLLVFASYVFKEAIKSAFQEVRSQVGHLNTFLQEHITGMNITQYFARENQEMHKFKQINAKHRDANIRSNWYYSIFFPVVEIISALSLGLLVWYGSKSIIDHDTSPGVIIAFIMYINMMFRPIRELADKFNTLQMGMVGADRVFTILDTHDEEENSGSFATGKLDGAISFENVWFAYNENNWVLKDISFTVEPGQTLALVGATGAGKSSVINILNRFYEIGKGSVKIDGLDIRDYELGYLRSQIATVIQDVFLFSDSIANNITLNNPAISRDQLIKAATEAGAADFINRLPEGFDYNVMERGATLSAGQAQLISFIRALVYNPKILVLDEATSSVDTETELLIQQTLQKLMKGRTSIVIAHRLSTIQNADKIIVLDQGEIKEMGSHQQLLQHNGYYKRLFDLQFNSSGIEKTTFG